MTGAGLLATIESWVGFPFPQWARAPGLLAIVGAVVVAIALALAVEFPVLLWRRRQSRTRPRGG